MRDQLGSATPKVAILRYTGCQLSAVHGLEDMFVVASQLSVKARGSELSVSIVDPPVEPDEDDQREAEAGWDFIVVPGRLAGPLQGDEAAPIASWLTRRHAGGDVLASSCGGAFLLAATGALDGRTATTHWNYAASLQKVRPKIVVDADRILIDHGDVITGGGLLAWTDVGLRIVSRLLGEGVAGEVARFFLLDPAGREQCQYRSFAPKLDHRDGAIRKVQEQLEAQLAIVSVGEMARGAGLEDRTFLRRFRAATGLSPSEYVRELRLERARELLRSTSHPVSGIAWDVGYADPTAFARLFHRAVGVTPGDYRRRFSPRAQGRSAGPERRKSASPIQSDPGDDAISGSA